MNRKSSPDLQALKMRHFFLQTKIDDAMKRSSGCSSVLTDSEINELMESIWIAERAREAGSHDLVALRSSYRLSCWIGRDTSADALRHALERATAFYENLEVDDQAISGECHMGRAAQLDFAYAPAS